MLEVFIQSILYLRDVYPAAIFRKRKMYNTAVFVSVYPKLNDYLKQVLASVKFLKTKNQLRRVELIISRLKNEPDIDLIEAYDEYLFNSGSTPVKSPTSTTHKLVKQTVIEKFVFEIDRPKTPDKNGNYRNKPSMLDDLNSKDKYLIEFEEELRRALIELEQMSRNLKGLDEDEERSFKINVETTQSAFVDLTSDSALQVNRILFASVSI